MDIQRFRTVSPPPAGFLRLVNDSNGLLKVLDPNGSLKTIQMVEDDTNLVPLSECYDGEPTNYSAPNPASASASTFTYTGAGAAGSLVLTAQITGSDDYILDLVDPALPDQTLSVVDDAETKTVTVNLATGVGDKAASTIPASGDDMVLSVSTAGIAGNSVLIDAVLPTFIDPFGGLGIVPSYSISCSVLNEAYIVLLPTDTGTSGILTLTESSLSAGEIVITQATDKVGEWGNQGVDASIVIGDALSSLAVVCTSANDLITIAITLGADADGLPVASSDDDLAAAIETALETVNGDTDLSSFFVVTSATAGNFDTAMATVSMVGGADPVLDATPIAVADFQLVLTGAVGSDLEVTTVGTGNYVPLVDTHVFAGGGENAAITTTLAELKAGLLALPSTLILGGAITTGETLCEDTTITLTGGLDIGETAAEVLGTPAHLGRIATDGTDVWTALKEDPTTSQDGWVKTFTA